MLFLLIGAPSDFLSPSSSGRFTVNSTFYKAKKVTEMEFPTPHETLVRTSTVMIQVTGRQITSMVTVKITGRKITSTVTVQETGRQNNRQF